MAAPGEATLSDWTPTILTKFIRDLFLNTPPDFLPNLRAENIDAYTSLTIRDKVVLTREPSWRKVGGTGQPPFANSWVAYAAGEQVPGFWRDPFGWVYLRGTLKSGTLNTTAFTLPPGFRPLLNESFPAVANSAFAYCSVNASGAVTPVNGSNVWFSLAGISFKTN